MRFGFKNYIGVILFLALTQVAWGGVGVAGGQILQENYGARAAALAGAFGAQSGDLDSLVFNPAGLADLEKVDIKFWHAASIESIMTEWFAVAIPAGDLGVLAAQILYRGQPSIDNQVEGEAVVDSKEFMFGASFARPIIGGISAGFNIQVLSLTLGPANTTDLVFDLGAQYALGDNTRFGLAVRHLGQEVKFQSAGDALPTVATVSAQWIPWPEDLHLLSTELDLDREITESNWVTRLGIEYWFKGLLALRTGYVYSATRSVSGVTAGVGFKFNLTAGVDMKLDYSLQPQTWEVSDFEMVNRLSLGVTF